MADREPQRLPLPCTLEFRKEVTTTDAALYNGYVEKESEVKALANKRAGTVSKITGAGTGHGIFVYGTNLYSWDSGVSNTTPTVTALGSFVSP